MVFAPSEKELKQQIAEDKTGKLKESYERTKKARREKGVPERGLTREGALARVQAQKQIDDAKARSENRPAYGKLIPFAGLFGSGQDMAAQIMGQRFIDLIDNPNVKPIYNQAGRLTGVIDEFGRRTGYDQEQILANMVDKMNSNEPEKQQAIPPNPVTGQCPAGYTYDANAQACMPVFASQVPTSFNYEPYTPAPTLLDQSSGLLDVDPMFGQPMDFSYGMPRVRLI